MRRLFALVIASFLFAWGAPCAAQAPPRVVDVPTRPGVTERMILIAPADAKAVVVLLAGSHGGLQITPEGAMRWGEGNFLVRSRELFAREHLAVAVLDAPSDHMAPRFLEYFRQTPEHVADLKAVIAWLRETTRLPVWLVG